GRRTRWLAAQRAPKLALGLRADPRNLGEPSGLGRLAQSGEVANAEHPPDLEHPPHRDAEEARQARELRRDLALELLQPADPAGLHELAQPSLDAWADPSQLANAPLAHEVLDRRGRRPDQLGRAAVGPCRVRPGAGEVEQRGERLEPLRD